MILRYEQQLIRFSEVCKLALKEDQVHEIILRPYKKNRSAEQNKYYWKILSIIAEYTGSTKENLHDIFKEKFLIDIYKRTKDDYVEMMGILKKMRQNNWKRASDILKIKIVEMTSTSDANIKEMAEYLTSIIRYSEEELNCMLPRPEDKSLIRYEEYLK